MFNNKINLEIMRRNTVPSRQALLAAGKFPKGCYALIGRLPKNTCR